MSHQPKFFFILGFLKIIAQICLSYTLANLIHSDLFIIFFLMLDVKFIIAVVVISAENFSSSFSL